MNLEFHRYIVLKTTDVESGAKKCQKCFAFVQFYYQFYSFQLSKSHLEYKICVELPYYTSLGHLSFQRYNGFNLKLIFQKIQKLGGFEMFLIAAELYLTKSTPILIIFKHAYCEVFFICHIKF